MQKRKSGRGRDDSRPYPFTDLFDLRAYASAVYILSLMGNVYQMLRDEIPFPMIEVWRHSPEEITRFKQMDNAVLFAAGSCWEGVDFPGDMVSSLIIVKLPFAVPDPISEAQKKEYASLKDYIQAVIVPDMQKKLRQGFGRALRTETDTCVVSILDERAGEGGRYHEEVMCALPSCKMAKTSRISSTLSETGKAWNTTCNRSWFCYRKSRFCTKSLVVFQGRFRWDCWY